MAEWTKFPAKFDSTCKKCKKDIKQGETIWGAKGMPGVKASAWFVVCAHCYNSDYKDGSKASLPFAPKPGDAGLSTAIKSSESEESMADLMALLKEQEGDSSAAVVTVEFPSKSIMPEVSRFIPEVIPYSMAWIEQNASWRM
jgi:hypothetical protein